jgi:hypothetical protein
MTSPTNISPNTGNYRVGKGSVYIKLLSPTVDTDFRHMGNCTTFELTPTVEKLDHFSSMAGLKLKDESIAISQGGALKITMEEWTAKNMGLMLMGAVDEGASGGPTVEILGETVVEAEVKFISANEVGPRWNFDLYRVSFTPSGAMNPISDEWGDMEVTGEVLASQTAPNAGKFGLAQVTNIDS